jgi:ABC-2 type transport system ATP-binding protein
MLEAQDLTRRYGDFTAVEKVSFSVQEGEIVGMLGPNGAGKTTTLRMLTGFLAPSVGRVRVAGYDLEENPLAARRQIGYLPEHVALYPELRTEEYLGYRARLEGLTRADARQAIGEVLERCLIADVRRQIIGTLSKGYRQRVGLAAAILHRPKVLVLDEPTVGLDPKQIIAIRELIRELGRNHTLLLSTHILPEVELLCHRVLIIDRGHIVAHGSPETLRDRWRGNRQVVVTLQGDPPDAGEALEALPGVLAASRDSIEPGRWRIEAEGQADSREAAFRLAVERGWVLLELSEEKASLEDIFVRLTTRDEMASAAPEEASRDGEATPMPPEEPAAGAGAASGRGASR